MLARREHSSGELAAALVRKGYTAEAVAATVTDLTGEKLLNDSRYADALVRMLAARGQGPRRVRQALAQASLTDSQIATALEAGPDWGTLADEVRRRKFGASRPNGWPQRARQMRFLQYRGFSTDHIASALGSSGADETLEEPTEPDS
jgi:regulatory protein